MITDPAAIHASSPIDTGATNAFWTPVLTFRPIVVRPFGRPSSCGKVHGDASRRDVRVLTDVRVAEVRQVRHFRPSPDARVLDLNECPGLGACLEDRAGAKVTEWPHERALPDLGVDDHGMGTDLGASSDAGGTPDDGERMHHRVGLDLDLCVDPRRLRVDDRDPREHVRFVDPVSQASRGHRELCTCVHSNGLLGFGGLVDRDLAALGDEQCDGVGEVELTLGVVGLESLENRPQSLAAKDVDGGVDLAYGELIRCRVPGLDDGLEAPLAVSNDAAIGASDPSGSNDRTVAHAAARRWPSTNSRRRLAVTRGVSPERTSTSSARPSTTPRALRTASPVPSGCSCTATCRPSKALAADGEATTTMGSAPSALAVATTQSTIRRPSSGWRCFGRLERMRVPRPAAITTAASVFSSMSVRWLGRQDSNLGSRDQNPLPYHLATPQCWSTSCGEPAVGHQCAIRIRRRAPLRTVHGARHSRPGGPGQSSGCALRVFLSLEEPVDGRAGAAHIGAERSELFELRGER